MYVQNANKSHIVHHVIVRHVSLNVIVCNVLDSLIRVLFVACFAMHIYTRICSIHGIFHGVLIDASPYHCVEAMHAYSRLTSPVHSSRRISAETGANDYNLFQTRWKQLVWDAPLNHVLHMVSTCR